MQDEETAVDLDERQGIIFRVGDMNISVTDGTSWILLTHLCFNTTFVHSH